jgi:predicted phage terminase large subunit-like protein
MKTLLLDRLQTGSILFDREKQNDPSGMKGQFLNVDWLHYYDWKEIPDFGSLVFYAGVDLAISEKETADQTVICLVGYERLRRRVFLIDFKVGRWDFPTQLKEIQKAYTEWGQMGMRPIKVVIEDNAYQKAMAQQIASTTWIPAIGRRTDKDKISKMLSVSPHFENMSVLIRKSELNGMPEFRKEWTQFPFAKHDDMLDAAAIIILELALGGTSTLGVIDPEEMDAIAEDCDYIFCGKCGEEYGTVNGRMPKINGQCDLCGTEMKKIPKEIWENV